MNGRPAWDLRRVLLSATTQFVPWLAAVALVTWAGYPGIVCVTPMAWLIALRVGLLVMTHSTSPGLGRRYQEAALAGAILGLLQGSLLTVILFTASPVSQTELPQSIILCVVLTLAGLVAGAGLALITAGLTARRLAREMAPPP